MQEITSTNGTRKKSAPRAKTTKDITMPHRDVEFGQMKATLESHEKRMDRMEQASRDSAAAAVVAMSDVKNQVETNRKESNTRFDRQDEKLDKLLEIKAKVEAEDQVNDSAQQVKMAKYTKLGVIATLAAAWLSGVAVFFFDAVSKVFHKLFS